MKAAAFGFALVALCAPRLAADPASKCRHAFVQFETTRGDFIIEVRCDWALIGAARFEELVAGRFFDGQKFFRVRAGDIAQFGLHPDPRMIARWKGRTILDDTVRTTNARGTLAYAMTGPNTRSTQIYINLKDNRQLDRQGFAPFARVTGGMNVVDQLYSGYGDSAGGGMRGGKQGPIEAEGNAYLEKNFPRLDFIGRAFIIRRGMGNGTERDFSSDPRELTRRRFMLAGEHVILRAFERDDAERCHRWMNDPNIVRTLNSRYPMAFQNEVEWVDRAMHADPNERHFAIERKDDRSHIGNASIHDIDWVSRNAWFGLFIGEPTAWNRGFGGDAIQTLGRFAFDEMNLSKLSIRVFDYNDRAKHVLESHGFVQEGCLKRDFYREGAFHDIVLYSMFREPAK